MQKTSLSLPLAMSGMLAIRDACCNALQPMCGAHVKLILQLSAQKIAEHHVQEQGTVLDMPVLWSSSHHVNTFFCACKTFVLLLAKVKGIVYEGVKDRNTSSLEHAVTACWCHRGMLLDVAGTAIVLSQLVVVTGVCCC